MGGQRNTIYEVSRRVLTDRWTRVATFGAAVTLTSCLYAGWQQYSLLLLRGEKYIWTCGSDELVRSESGILTCPAQERAIGRLFPLAAALELLGSVFAGFALDHCGPRSTALIGEVLGLLAIIMIMMSKPSINLMPASMVVTGIAINLVAFPALILEDYFPTAAATTASYVVSCQALSCLIAPVLWLMWQYFPHWTFNGIWSVYLVVVWIPTSLLYVLSLPQKRETHAGGAENPQEAGSRLIPSPLVEPPSVGDAPTAPALGEESTPRSILAIHIQNSPSQDPATTAKFIRACFSSEFVVLNIINMVLMLQTAYYQVIVRATSGMRISDFIGWAMPTQAVWGLLLGRVVDRIKTPKMIIAVLAGYCISYLLVLTGKSAIQYLTASMFLIAMSYAYTVKYSFIQETFPPSFYGKLVGIAGGLSGGSVLLTNVLTNTKSVPFWCVILAASSIAAAPMGGYLCWCAHRRKQLTPKKVSIDVAGIEKGCTPCDAMSL